MAEGRARDSMARADCGERSTRPICAMAGSSSRSSRAVTRSGATPLRAAGRNRNRTLVSEIRRRSAGLFQRRMEQFLDAIPTVAAVRIGRHGSIPG